MKSHKNSWFLFYFLCSLALITFAFITPLDGDEGVYLYQSQMIAIGKLPVQDFFASHPFMFYAPYALTQKIAHGLLSARMFSVIGCISLLVMITQFIKRDLGNRYAIIAGIIFILDIAFIQRNIVVKHYLPSNLFFFASFYVLAKNKNNPKIKAFAGGLLFGLAVNCRIIFALLLPLFIVFLWKQFRPFWKFFILFTLGGVIASSVSIYFMSTNLDGFIFNSISWRFYSYSALGYDFTHPVLDKIKEFASFLFEYGGINFLAILMGIFGVVISKKLNWPFIFGVGIILIYCFADKLFSSYLSQAIPFFIIAGLYGFSSLRKHFPKISLAYAAFYGTACVYVLMVFILSIYTSDLTIKSIKSLNTVSTWIEENTSPDAVFLSWFVAPVANTSRHNLAGLEQGYHTGAFFCEFDQALANRYHIATCNDIRQAITNGEVHYIIDDSYSELVVKNGFQDYRSILNKYFEQTYQFGGYTIYHFNPYK